MTRTAVPRSSIVRVIGVDSGSANVGVAGVAGDPTKGVPGCRCHFLEYVQTKKADLKLRRKIRVSTDDRSRLNKITDRVGHILALNAPDGVAVEWYQPNPYKKSKDGWKAALTAAGILTLARERRITSWEQLPADAKKITGMAKPTKEDVEAWLCENLPGFAEAIAKIAPSNREHPSDAAAHALAGIFELHERRLEASL